MQVITCNLNHAPSNVMPLLTALVIYGSLLSAFLQVTFPTLHTSWACNILVLWSFRAKNPCRPITPLSFVVFSTWLLLLVTLWTLVWISIPLISTQLILSLLNIAHELPLFLKLLKTLLSPVYALHAIYNRCGWSPPRSTVRVISGRSISCIRLTHLPSIYTK